MAFCSSSAGLRNGVYLVDDCPTGIKLGKLCRENKVFNGRGLGFPSSAGTSCRTIAVGALSSRYHETRRRHMFEIRSMLVPREVGSESVASPTIKNSQEGRDVSVAKDPDGSDVSASPVLEEGGGSGDDGNGKFHSGGGGGGGDDNTGDDKEEEEFGPLLKFEEVMKEAEARGASLPSDLLGAAKATGIRKVLLDRYLDLQAICRTTLNICLYLCVYDRFWTSLTQQDKIKQIKGSAWPLGFVIRTCSLIRNRMLADPTFLFKIGTEIVIDSCCATFAEIQKRGKDFWNEFELYVADLLVGVVVNVALVGLLAPYARIGQPSASKGLLGQLQRAYGALPSSVFEAERPGCKFSIQQRLGTYFFKGFLYASVGFVCGLVGQGIANLIMNAKRSIKKSEEDIPVPPLLKSAALWGVFLAVSSNTRYQIINLLERLVEASALAKQVPAVASAFTVGVRFANNVYGGMQFVDWARWSGVQ